MHSHVLNYRPTQSRDRAQNDRHKRTIAEGSEATHIPNCDPVTQTTDDGGHTKSGNV